jgi:hypothetical protein
LEQYIRKILCAYTKSGTDPNTWTSAKAYEDAYAPKLAEAGFDQIITEAGKDDSPFSLPLTAAA